jgi:triosephosphate isomerase (TIM)
MRKAIIAGNWKMNKTIAEAQSLAEGVKIDLAEETGVDVVLCPPFTALKTVSDVVSGTQIKLGAQNVHFEQSGAYTGEVSPAMLRDLYCHYVILGHSERRAMFGESSAIVNRKVKAALAGNLLPIVCVGETLEERDAGQVETVVETQVRESLADISAEEMKKIIIAYEPVWAIGTGRTASPEQAQEVHALIRDVLRKMYDDGVAQAVRIQYGGSMKPSNAAELLAQPDIDGGLIGGAALDPHSFVQIVVAARQD